MKVFIFRLSLYLNCPKPAEFQYFECSQPFINFVLTCKQYVNEWCFLTAQSGELLDHEEADKSWEYRNNSFVFHIPHRGWQSGNSPCLYFCCLGACPRISRSFRLSCLTDTKMFLPHREDRETAVRYEPLSVWSSQELCSEADFLFLEIISSICFTNYRAK